MSNWRDFVQDFPKRCKDLLLLAHEAAVANDREVTLSLMVASAGFLIPFERLRDDSRYIHPAQDRARFPSAAQKLDQLLGQCWLSSPLHQADSTSWSAGSLGCADPPPESWPELEELTPLSPCTKVKDLVVVMRIGLAHGNVYSLTAGGKIKALVFVSGGVERRSRSCRLRPYRYVYVSPSDFRGFLLRWFDLLASLQLTQQEVIEALEQAA